MPEEIPLSLIEILILRFSRVVGYLIPLVLAFALLIFLFGLARFLLRADNEIERRRGQRIMVWGVAILFVMSSIWGIISFIGQNLLINQGGIANSPQVNLPKAGQ